VAGSRVVRRRDPAAGDERSAWWEHGCGIHGRLRLRDNRRLPLARADAAGGASAFREQL